VADDEGPVVVMETGNAVVVALARSLLSEANIPFATTGEGLQDILGGGRFGLNFNPVSGPVRFLVPPGFEEEARGVLADCDGGGRDG